MKQKLFLLSIIVFSFIITGCSRNNSLAYDESIQVQKEENKLDNNMDRIKDWSSGTETSGGRRWQKW